VKLLIQKAISSVAHHRFLWAGILLFFLYLTLNRLTDAFFLFDDYYHLDAASHIDVQTLFFKKSTNVFRPTAFALWRAQFALGGWTHPWVYLLSSATMHGVSTLLLYRVGKNLGLDTRTASISSIFFLLSPWSSEVVAWASGQMDLDAALLGLLATFFATAAFRAQSRGAECNAHALCAASFCLALCAKEAAFAVPLLIPCILAPNVIRERSPRFFRLVGVFAIGLAVYVALRVRIIGVFKSEYGSYGELMSQADLFHNLRRYVSAYVFGLPFDQRTSPWNTAFRIAAGVLLLANGLRAARPRAVGLALAFLVSLLPVLWVETSAYTTQPGRFRYIPGLFVCLLFGNGFSALQDAFEKLTGNLRALVWIFPVASAIAMARSLAFQQSVWSLSSRMAKQAIEQFEPLLGTNTPVFIPNLAYGFSMGVHGLKPYAFRMYFRGRNPPPVSAKTLGLRAASHPSPDQRFFGDMKKGWLA